MAERLGERLRAACFAENIEVVEQRVAIAQNTEYTTARATLVLIFYPEVQFGKVQNDRIAPLRVYRDRIREVAITLIRIKTRIRWKIPRKIMSEMTSSLEIGVGVP